MASMGKRCPEDISVVGFDDIDVASHYLPPLTTVHQPRERIGRMAAEALLDILEAPSVAHTPRRVVLRSEFVERASTAPWHEA
jgi:LacI family repressor for deo operon, udp, cdd, tsx, nupC, and nupG